MLARDINPAGTAWAAHLRDWLWSLLLLPVCVYLCLTRGEYTMWDHASLILHEAGHLIFGLAGLMLIGGTLMQLLLPGLLAFHFYRHRYRLGMQVMVLWLGQNLINVSVYAADARARRLPLLGGEYVLHDWHVMLGRLGLLHYDLAVGWIFFTLAIACFVIVVAAPRIIRSPAHR